MIIICCYFQCSFVLELIIEDRKRWERYNKQGLFQQPPRKTRQQLLDVAVVNVVFDIKGFVVVVVNVVFEIRGFVVVVVNVVF